MVIYTKRGDKGKTSLFNRKRMSKSSLIIESIGFIDELNSYLGVVISEIEDEKLKEILESIQKDLFTIGSITAGSKLIFPKTKTNSLEKMIDNFERSLPVLKNFILPGGSKVSSKLHFARALTRDCERRIVELSEAEKINVEILRYLNRLSDFLFILARKENYDLGIKEKGWTRKG